MKTRLNLAVAITGLVGVVSLNAADVTGKISFSDANGAAPEPQKIAFDPTCGALHETEEFVKIFNIGEDNGLADVLVYVKEGLPEEEYSAPGEPALLDQVDCIYTPYISSMQVGQKLLVRNSDQLFHNVNVTDLGKNLPQLPNAADLEFEINEEHRFLRFKCDIHPWMFAYVNAVSNPYHATSKADGTFEIKGLPAGEYTLEAHHRRLGMKEMKLTVGDDGATADFTFEMPEE